MVPLSTNNHQPRLSVSTTKYIIISNGLFTLPDTDLDPNPGMDICPHVQSASKWYASYWNAFLFTLPDTDLDPDLDKDICPQMGTVMIGDLNPDGIEV